MTAQAPLPAAMGTLQAALGLYARHIVLLTALSLPPALARVALFLEAPWMAGPMGGWVELMVGGFRFALLFAAFRLVWPQGLAGLEAGMAGGALLRRIAWPAVAWQVVLLVLVPLILNLAAGLLAGLVTGEPREQNAILFALKNLFVIPFWMVHLLVAIRTAIQG